jgi:phage gpG-like protein
MIRFISTVEGIETFNRVFNRIDEFISDFRSVWPLVAQEFYQIEEEQFASEGAAGLSGKWAPLSAPYKRWKEIHFPGQPILKLSNAMYESLTSPDAPDSIFLPEPEQLTIGTKVPYGRRHQRTRPVISMNEEQKRRIQKAIQRELVQFTRSLGFQVDERAA